MSISPFFLTVKEECSKIIPSFFTIKEGPPLISVFSPQGRRGKPSSGARNRFALWLADHQRSSLCCAGWDFADSVQ